MLVVRVWRWDAVRRAADTTLAPVSAGGSGRGHHEAAAEAGLPMRAVVVLRVVLIGLMLLGGVLVGFGVKMLVDTRRFLATAEVAEGAVVRVDEAVMRDETRRFPVVEFRTAYEQVAQFQADNGSLKVGDSVRLLYDPANPRNARLDNWGNRWAGPIALWGAGLTILVVNGVILLLMRSARGRAAQGARDGDRPLARGRLLGRPRRQAK
jgi:hypothetical protein